LGRSGDHELVAEELAIVSVNVAQPAVLLRHPGGDVISGIATRPVEAPALGLTRLNLAGDGQADTRPTRDGGQVHGGPDQAVYAFPAHHFGRLGQLAGQPVGPGFMGENLTVTGVTEHDVRIGDVWAWGPTRLQVSAPRGPCYKLGIRMGKQAARTAIRQEGMIGWYLRVLVPGEVPVRGPLTVADRHPAGVTVAQVHAALQRRDQAFPELAALDVMSANLRGQLSRRGRDLTGGVPEQD
jgi:MOSC domain-containing protein YiiM